MASIKQDQHSFLRAFGPGLLFAAVAIGVSHLVQSTRAGALYGPLMILFVVAAMAVKYPFYRFGPQYTAATGKTLVDAFRRQGLWLFIPFALLMFLTSFIVVAAVVSGTAVIAANAFYLPFSPVQIATGLLLLNIAIISVGRYRWLDVVMKLFMLLLTVTTLIATVQTLPIIDWSRALEVFPPGLDKAAIIFTVALVGWMPSPLEGAVGHSIWTKAKAVDSEYRPRVKESILDFHIGYLGTMFLSLCFMVLGAGVLHEQGNALARGASQFTAQFIALYESALGEWSGWLIRVSAVAVMYSTLLAATDNYARMIAGIILRFREPEKEWVADDMTHNPRLRPFIVMILSLGGLAVFLFLAKSFKVMLAIATSTAFISAPLIAILIYRAINSTEISEEDRPSTGLLRYSLFCIVVLLVFAFSYIGILFW